jgi:ABC-type Fe3+-siderophore transport system permease subunit
MRSPDRLWQTLTGSGTRIEQYVVFQVRAPRTAMALVTGAALGIAGALLQSYLGNPSRAPISSVSPAGAGSPRSSRSSPWARRGPSSP